LVKSFWVENQKMLAFILLKAENDSMPKSDGFKNLRPVTTKEEARRRGTNGAKASIAARQKKKLMSSIYAEFLAEKFSVKLNPMDPKDKPQAMTGEKLINIVVKAVLLGGGPPAVSLMKEIREATEGSKFSIADDGAPSAEERALRIAELRARLGKAKV
jgi:hypothetical protein